MRQPTHKDLLSFGVLASLLILFYPTLLLGKSGELIADHLQQHYPWSYLLSTSLKQFKLPFWTSFIHCGFPIAAESQIGIFYPINLLLFFFLPFHFAYSYTTLIHFWIAGWGTYLYCKRMDLSASAACFGSILFVFGAAYGGAYYNITSLKTICWFPVSLFLFEKFYLSGKKMNLLWLTLVLACAALAGYLQVAVFMILMFLIYVFLRVYFFCETRRLSKMNKSHQILWILVTLVGVVVLVFPQLFLTFELAIRSNRTGLVEDYAYVGSMSPFALSTILFSSGQGIFRGNSIYCGIFSILLILCAMFSKRIRSFSLFRIWIAMGIISLLLALGEWSPLYVALIKLTHFYAFRTPMKFLVFICFSLAIIGALGFQEAWTSVNSSEKTVMTKQVAHAYLLITILFVILVSTTYYFLNAGRDVAIQFGDWFVGKYVYGRAGHPHSLDFYHTKVLNYLIRIGKLFSWHEIEHVWSYSVIFIGVLFSFFLLWAKQIRKSWFFLGLFFLLIDLYAFAWWDIKRDFNTYDQVLNESPILGDLAVAKHEGRLGRVYGFCDDFNELPFAPSSNILYGIEDIGAYTPFVTKRYYELFSRFGNINDSNASHSPKVGYLLERLNLLNLMDVSHIVSKQPLNHVNLTLLKEDVNMGIYLYANKGNYRRAFFVSKVKVRDGWEALKATLLNSGFDPHETLLLELDEMDKVRAFVSSQSNTLDYKINRIGDKSDEETWHIEISQPGFFVVSDLMYPGWEAKVNGKYAPIIKAYGVFKAVWLEKSGQYKIIFTYHPFRRKFNRAAESVKL